MTKTPAAGRPQMPADYGVPKDDQGLLPWSHVCQRMEAALNYWVASVDPQARPHVSPVWGVWVGETFYFDGSPETRRMRNLAANPKAAVHLENGSEVVILYGRVEPVGKPERELAEQIARAYTTKYRGEGYAPAPDQWDGGGLYRLVTQRALAWTKFPQDATRWQF